MNFLGHSLFAFGDPALMCGQFAGDFVRGRDLAAWPAGMATGIRLHRLVDATTDRHPPLAALRRAFPAEQRRFAGIALDVAIDHHIARDWSRHAATHASLPGSLAEQAALVDRALGDAAGLLDERWPDGLERLRGALQRDRLFERWASRDGVALTLERISRRSPRLAPLANAADTLVALDAHLEAVIEPLLAALHDACLRRLARSEDASLTTHPRHCLATPDTPSLP